MSGNQSVFIVVFSKDLNVNFRTLGICLETDDLLKTPIKMAGAAGLEPVTSAVTGQRSNQLSYAPAMGDETIENLWFRVKVWLENFEVLTRF